MHPPLPRIAPAAVGLLLLLSLIAGVPAAGGEPPQPAVGPWPLADPAQHVVHAFDPPPLPWNRGHRGVDLPAALGDPVLAPIAGRVVSAGILVDRGVVVIGSGALRISLEPVAASVSAGDQVAVGDQVGTVGPGRSHCAPAVCLHWGLRVAGVYHDPLLLVRRYRAVLLPLGE